MNPVVGMNEIPKTGRENAYAGGCGTTSQEARPFSEWSGGGTPNRASWVTRSMPNKDSGSNESTGAPWRDADNLRRLYWDEGLSLSEVGNRLGCSRTTVADWMEQLGIERRPQPGSEPDRPYTDREVLERLYNDEELTMREIGDRLGCGQTSVRRWMDKHGIERREASYKHHRGDKRYADLDILNRLYHDQNLTISEIADRFDTTPTSVRYWMKKYDIERRDWIDSLQTSYAGYGTDVWGYARSYSYTDGEMDIVKIHQLLAISEGADPYQVFSGGEYHVHHKNRIPWDNRPENLELLTNTDHARHHGLGELGQ